MARRRRLNKKVALVGSLVLIILGVAVVAVFLKLVGPGSEKLLQDGNAAQQEQRYSDAVRSYRAAYDKAKDNKVRIEILFRLADTYIQMDEWVRLRDCWRQIINIDPQNIEARFNQLKYFYILGDSGVREAWQLVREQASELVKVVENTDLLQDDTAKLASFADPKGDPQGQSLGAFLHLARGRADLEMARTGAVTDQDQSIEQAVKDLQEIHKYDPRNVDAYWYLAQAAITKGEILASRGGMEERNKARLQAMRLLEQAVSAADDDVKAHINLATMKLLVAREAGKEQILALEPEYSSLLRKFPSEPEAYLAVSVLHSDPRLAPEGIDKAIKAAEKAVELNPQSAEYAIKAADLYYRRFSISKQKADINKAIEIAKKGLTLPDAQDKEGPRQHTYRIAKVLLCSLLANCYLEQVLDPDVETTESEDKSLLSSAEEVVHQIEQVFGVGEEPRVVKWQGMLELARGNRESAIRKLNAAYEQLGASGRSDMQLSYTLAKIFMETPEIGAVAEYLVAALNAGISWTKPEARLDYAEVLSKLRAWTMAIANINDYEKMYGADRRSQMLRVGAYIGAQQFDEAENELANLKSDDPGTMKLELELIQAKIKHVRMIMVQRRMREDVNDFLPRPGMSREIVDSTSVDVMEAELSDYRQREFKLIVKLLATDPDAVTEPTIAASCRYYISNNQIPKAKSLVDQYLKRFPESTTAALYKYVLSEPDPGNVSEQRRGELELKVRQAVSDPVRRAMGLAVFYHRNGDYVQAITEFRKVLNAGGPGGEDKQTALNRQALAAGYLFDIALKNKDWELADEVIEIVRRENLDDCQGQFYSARLAMAKNEPEDALKKVDDCLRQVPIASRFYLLRSDINLALGSEHAYLADIRKSASLNPLNGAIARALANALYSRDKKLGQGASSDHLIETREALERSIQLNPGDWRLLSFYAEYISSSEPLKALAIRQDLQKTRPSMQNAVLLGKLATELAIKETEPLHKETLFDIAGSAFEEAMKIDPRDKVMLYNYTQYLRSRGQADKAEQVLEKLNEQRLLWGHYVQRGQFDEARLVLSRLYEKDSKDPGVLEGLLLVAEKILDKEGIIRYSGELLALEDSVKNNLLQIKSYLKVGLVSEAEKKLEVFRQKYPSESTVLLLEAWLAMRKGQLEKALELTNKNLQDDENNPGAWRLRGEINLLMGNYSRSILDLQKSKSLSPESATRISLARAYLQAGRGDDAVTELRNTIDSPGAPLEARELLERTYLRLNRVKDLTVFYDDTLERYPNSVVWLNRAGRFAMGQGAIDKAEQLYRKAYTLRQRLYADSSDREAMMKDTQFARTLDGYLQTLVLGAGVPNSPAGWKPEKLNKLFEEAKGYLGTELASIAYFRMAEAKMKLGDKTTAIEYCRKAVDGAGTDETLASEVLLRMFLLLGPDDGPREVSSYCEQKLKETPNSLAANFTMFNLAKINGEYNKAVRYIDKCISLSEEGSGRQVEFTVKKAEILTLAYQKSSDNNYLKQAIADYESLLAKMPSNISVLNNLAYMLAENDEKLADALRYIEKAVKSKPDDPSLLDTYAYVLHKNGNHSRAAEYMTAALQQYEQSEIIAPPEVYEHLGMIKEAVGQRVQALNAYEEALELGANRLSEAVLERIRLAVKRLSP